MNDSPPKRGTWFYIKWVVLFSLLAAGLIAAEVERRAAQADLQTQKSQFATLKEQHDRWQVELDELKEFNNSPQTHRLESAVDEKQESLFERLEPFDLFRFQSFLPKQLLTPDSPFVFFHHTSDSDLSVYLPDIDCKFQVELARLSGSDDANGERFTNRSFAVKRNGWTHFKLEVVNEENQSFISFGTQGEVPERCVMELLPAPDEPIHFRSGFERQSELFGTADENSNIVKEKKYFTKQNDILGLRVRLVLGQLEPSVDSSE